MILLVHSEKNSIDTIAMFNYSISKYTKQRRCKGSDGSSWDLLDVSGLVFFFFYAIPKFMTFKFLPPALTVCFLTLRLLKASYVTTKVCITQLHETLALTCSPHWFISLFWASGSNEIFSQILKMNFQRTGFAAQLLYAKWYHQVIWTRRGNRQRHVDMRLFKGHHSPFPAPDNSC